MPTTEPVRLSRTDDGLSVRVGDNVLNAQNGLTLEETAIAYVAELARAEGRPLYAVADSGAQETHLVVHLDGTSAPRQTPGHSDEETLGEKLLDGSRPNSSVTETEPAKAETFAPEAATATQSARKTPAAPTLTDLLATRKAPPNPPAQTGWRAMLGRASGGRLHLPPGAVETRLRDQIRTIQRSLQGTRTVVVVNPKGGGTKTTATVLLSATFGTYRGGSVLAWDNNETRGTLGWRARQSDRHSRTAIDLLKDMEELRTGSGVRIGDLDSYVRPQGSAHFDVLASDEDAASTQLITGSPFRALHETLSRFYRLLVVDTGNNMRASNWRAAVDSANQLVIVSTAREDTAQSAAWLIDGLRAAGKTELVENAVTVLTRNPHKSPDDKELRTRLYSHFGSLTRAVVEVPHDRALVGGGPIELDLLQQRTRDAWVEVAATVATGL